MFELESSNGSRSNTSSTVATSIPKVAKSSCRAFRIGPSRVTNAEAFDSAAWCATCFASLLALVLPASRCPVFTKTTSWTCCASVVSLVSSASANVEAVRPFEALDQQQRPSMFAEVLQRTHRPQPSGWYVRAPHRTNARVRRLITLPDKIEINIQVKGEDWAFRSN